MLFSFGSSLKFPTKETTYKGISRTEANTDIPANLKYFIPFN